MRGPCYMGLCVPDDFGAIFLTDSSIPLHVRMTSVPGEVTHFRFIVNSTYSFDLFIYISYFRRGREGTETRRVV